MCVVDRRDDPGAYNPGANRAEVQAELEKHLIPVHGVLESNAVPAQVEIEIAPAAESAPQSPGIPVLTKTPGELKLLHLLTPTPTLRTRTMPRYSLRYTTRTRKDGTTTRVTSLTIPAKVLV